MHTTRITYNVVMRAQARFRFLVATLLDLRIIAAANSMLGICKTCKERFEAAMVALEQGAYTANAVVGIGVDS